MEIKKKKIISIMANINVFFDSSSEYEFDDGLWVRAAAECFGKRSWEIGAFSGVSVYSAFGEKAFDADSDVTRGAFKNIFLGRKKAVRQSSVPYAKSGDDDLSFSWKFVRKVPGNYCLG